MGLNYGFDILIHREKLWEAIDSLVELAQRSRDHKTKITLGSQDRIVPWPWDSSDEMNILPLNEADPDEDFCLSIPFSVDKEIQSYLDDVREKSRAQHPEQEPWEPEYDSQRRPLIGCIYFRIVIDSAAQARTGYDKDMVSFEFRAATTRMSYLFQQSQSVQRTFLDLAKKHEATYCLFATGGQGQPTVLWLDGVETSIRIPDDSFPLSEVRRIVAG